MNNNNRFDQATETQQQSVVVINAQSKKKYEIAQRGNSLLYNSQNSSEYRDIFNGDLVYEIVENKRGKSVMVASTLNHISCPGVSSQLEVVKFYKRYRLVGFARSSAIYNLSNPHTTNDIAVQINGTCSTFNTGLHDIKAGDYVCHRLPDFDRDTTQQPADNTYLVPSTHRKLETVPLARSESFVDDDQYHRIISSPKFQRMLHTISLYAVATILSRKAARNPLYKSDPGTVILPANKKAAKTPLTNAVFVPNPQAKQLAQDAMPAFHRHTGKTIIGVAQSLGVPNEKVDIMVSPTVAHLAINASSTLLYQNQ